jgi:hypothetical protein
VHRRIRVYPFGGRVGDRVRADRERAGVREFQVVEAWAENLRCACTRAGAAS